LPGASGADQPSLDDHLILARYVLLWQRVLMQSADGASVTGAVFDLPQSCQQAPPVDGGGDIRQLRSVMAAVAALGRQWVPSAVVIPGSFVELSDRELEALSLKMRERNREYVRAQIAQLEAVGFMPVLPDSGPPSAAGFQRLGEVRAEQLAASHPWRNRAGDKLAGVAGDWHVVDESGDERTVRDKEFRDSHEQLDGNRWCRTGTVRAWQVSDAVGVRTLEGDAEAQPGDWIIQGPSGVRWPVKDEQFARGYRRVRPDTAEPAVG
jgi:hypothetical protein